MKVTWNLEWNPKRWQYRYVTIVYQGVQVSGVAVAMNGVNTEINILLDPKHNSCQGFAHIVCTNFTVVVTAHETVIVSLL